MSDEIETVDALQLGPQYARDAEFKARMRCHQSWYRAARLGKLPGDYPRATDGATLGSRLTIDDGLAGWNFVMPEIAAKADPPKPGRSRSATRLRCDMLASPPMCWNLFGPLVGEQERATRFFRALMPGEVEQVTAVRIEYYPGWALLEDRTAFDAFVEYTRANGETAFVGIETKLTEPFTPRGYHITDLYRNLTGDSASPWRRESQDELLNQLATPRFNQLWRDHMLTFALQQSLQARGRLLLAYHPDDPTITSTVTDYQTFLTDGNTPFETRSLACMVQCWQSVAADEWEQKWLNRFSSRYLELDKSEHAWQSICLRARQRAPKKDGIS